MTRATSPSAVPPNLGPNQRLDRAGLDAFRVAVEYAVGFGDPSGSYKTDYLGPWKWKDGELVVTPHFCFWRLGDAEPAPPAPVLKMLKAWRVRAPAVTVDLALLRSWAGTPLHLKCTCEYCGSRFRRTDPGPAPGWVGKYLVDRRFIALALRLSDSSEESCQICLVPDMVGDGGPVRLDGDGWWAGIMGLSHLSDSADAPRFEL